MYVCCLTIYIFQTASIVAQVTNIRVQAANITANVTNRSRQTSLAIRLVITANIAVNAYVCRIYVCNLGNAQILYKICLTLVCNKVLTHYNHSRYHTVR